MPAAANFTIVVVMRVSTGRCVVLFFFFFWQNTNSPCSVAPKRAGMNACIAPCAAYMWCCRSERVERACSVGVPPLRHKHSLLCVRRPLTAHAGCPAAQTSHHGRPRLEPGCPWPLLSSRCQCFRRVGRQEPAVACPQCSRLPQLAAAAVRRTQQAVREDALPDSGGGENSYNMFTIQSVACQ